LASHRKRKKLAPLAATLSVLVAVAVGGYALAGGRAPETVDLASAAAAVTQHVNMTACFTSGKLTRASVTDAARCPAKSAPFHWAVQRGSAGSGTQHVNVTACVTSGTLTRASVTGVARCPAKSARFHWAVQRGPAGSGTQHVNVTACVTSGTLTRLSVTGVARCPAKSAQFHWAVQPGTASAPSPVTSSSTTTRPSSSAPKSAAPSTSSPGTTSPSSDPATTSPSPVQTTTSPAPAPTSTHLAPGAWCSSAAFGQQAIANSPFDLYNNEWDTAANPGPQTICGNSASDWQVTSNQRAGNTEVLTYPSVQLNYNGTHGYPLSKFTSMTSSYTENMNAVSGTDAEAAYDIWINNLNKEVMIWVDNHGQTPAGSKVATTTFSGATWNLYETSNKGYMAFVREGNASSGTVDLLAALNYLEGRGDLTASDVLWQVNLGWEIASTAGAPETFAMSNYSLTSSPSS
jgi:hypothetical protein